MILLQIALAENSSIPSLIMFALIFAVMYFFMIRPQLKKQKNERNYRSSLRKGDSVITIGGIYGKIIDIKEDSFIIEVHSGGKLKVVKTSISMTGEPDIDQK